MKISAEKPKGKTLPAKAAVEAANRVALKEPGKDGYVNAVQIYPYVEGALYQLYAAPERVSDIALQPGENLVSVAAGDTVRWIVGDTTSGAGTDRRTHILVKPTAPGIQTNLIITTDRRSYHLQMEATQRTAMAALSWTYPADELLAIKRAGDAAQARSPIAEGLDIDRLYFGYEISGDNPSWRPVRVFDDGVQVFIAFPATIAHDEAPPLFVTGAKGEAQLVNYRMRGNYYIVDRLFEAAELRLGTKPQSVVRITRKTDRKSRRREKRS
ncbi:P-type conjugative transfer protein TrbG [Parasphingorhabdus sp.]|uniref:P-type conjugative transfer protein TrbG n=1 Tax=Parasphingorhabdus sp. TaxID=2709688 RepID=UPI0039E614B4